jgi:hypothetical protein
MRPIPARPSILLAAALLAACANKPPQPGWQMEAHGALERFADAALSGNQRVETAEFERARRELARTGRADLVARTELTRCAARVASLDVGPCEGFEKLRGDAGAAERAYADYLAGKPAAADAALLPAQHRAVAAAASGPGSSGAAAVTAIADPFARLVAAGVLFQAGKADPAVIEQAIATASDQGWRRPLLAWLHVQLQRAEAAGSTQEAERIKRRIGLVAGER